MAEDAPVVAKPVHPGMPPHKQGEDCPFLRDWVHFCDRGWRHKGAHHCPCGLEVDRGRA